VSVYGKYIHVTYALLSIQQSVKSHGR
jgi:hypothetical protein